MRKVKNITQLGALVREERKRQGLTQEQLAGLSGIGARFVRELEHGKESCHIGLAMQVMQTLGLSITIGSRGGN